MERALRLLSLLGGAIWRCPKTPLAAGRKKMLKLFAEARTCAFAEMRVPYVQSPTLQIPLKLLKDDGPMDHLRYVQHSELSWHRSSG